MYFDCEKVWGTFTEREARILKKAIRRKHASMVRVYIIKAMQRAQSAGMVLADFRRDRRERIVAN